MNKLFCFTIIGLFLSSCSLEPVYKAPVVKTQNEYKESSPWVKANPELALNNKNKSWWMLFTDATLNHLEKELTLHNPDIHLSLKRFTEAKALMQAAQSQQYPTLMAFSSVSKERLSDNIANPSDELTSGALGLQGLLTYEIDVWGKIRNMVAMSEHAAQASKFDLAAVELSLQSLLAATYFELLGANAEQKILDKEVDAYKHALRLVHNLHELGAVSALEEQQALNKFENAKTIATNMHINSAKLNHAIAVLLGKTPSEFKTLDKSSFPQLATVRPSLPSLLVEQRPDIAAAAQLVEAANDSIGVARAAFLPSFNFSATFGYKSQYLSSLFSYPSLAWSLGPPSNLGLIRPEVSQVVFDGYYLQANLRRAKAGYYQSVYSYQKTVLQAFQEVEDALVTVFRLHQELSTQEKAKLAAYAAFLQATDRMQDGMDTYLNVVDVEVTYLQAELDLISLKTRAEIASVNLIKALGGGWRNPSTSS
jgi:NodT family efflux transporter outer membrane factor (OMF) lipoprotein